MSAPAEHLWTYDRSEWPDRQGATTFSVGVYQWLPKSSGKGLKRSNSIRVLGYTIDPEAVYAKADEVCKKLNAAKAIATDLPAWVQKQYSVPKPENFTPKPRNDIAPKDAAKIRTRVMRELLLPRGFLRAHASTYAARDGEIVQVIHFHTFTWGGTFTVDLSLHHTFTPAYGGERMDWSRIEENHCTYRDRLGAFVRPGEKDWFDFGKDPELLERHYRFCAARSLEAFAKIVPIARDLEPILGRSFLSGRVFLKSLPDVTDASILLRLNRLDEARKLAEKALKRLPDPPHSEICRSLLQEIDRVAAGSPRRDWLR